MECLNEVAKCSLTFTFSSARAFVLRQTNTGWAVSIKYLHVGFIWRGHPPAVVI